jgi:hypothetical protein
MARLTHHVMPQERINFDLNGEAKRVRKKLSSAIIAADV